MGLLEDTENGISELANLSETMKKKLPAHLCHREEIQRLETRGKDILRHLMEFRHDFRVHSLFYDEIRGFSADLARLAEQLNLDVLIQEERERALRHQRVVRDPPNQGQTVTPTNGYPGHNDGCNVPNLQLLSPRSPTVASDAPCGNKNVGFTTPVSNRIPSCFSNHPSPSPLGTPSPRGQETPSTRSSLSSGVSSLSSFGTPSPC